MKFLSTSIFSLLFTVSAPNTMENAFLYLYKLGCLVTPHTKDNTKKNGFFFQMINDLIYDNSRNISALAGTWKELGRNS